MSGHQLCAKLKQYSKLTICWFGRLDLIVFVRTRMYGVSLGNTLTKINNYIFIYLFYLANLIGTYVIQCGVIKGPLHFYQFYLYIIYYI